MKVLPLHESVLVKVGEFGRWQKRTMALLFAASFIAG